MSLVENNPQIPDTVIETLARELLPKVQAFYEDEKVQKEFMRWKENQEKHTANAQDK